MAYTSLFIHMVWSTKYRRRQLTPEMTKTLFPYMAGIIRNLHGHPVIINGVEDHIHLLFRIPPALAVADIAREVKKSSSFLVNQQAGKRVLQWAIKYSAFSVNPRQIDVVRRYIANQAKHHRSVLFQQEIKTLLDDHEIDYDERYMWE